MNQTRNLVTDPIKFELLAQAMEDKEWNYEILASMTSVAEGTVKNILTGKTTHSSTQNVCALCNALEVPIEQVLGYSVKTELELKAVKENDAAFIALKELYDAQRAEMKEINETHISNIRSHYEQHHKDLKENYEKRLSDKREIIEILKAENEKLSKTLSKQEKSTRIGNIIRNIIIALFVIGVVVLLVMEFIHPEHGWLRF